MEIKGMISAVMPPQTGTSQSGNQWISQEFVLDYFWWPNQTTASKVVLRLFGEDRVKGANLNVGEEVNVRYHIEAREYQGRWYNEVRCDGVTPANKKDSTAEPSSTEKAEKPETPETVEPVGASGTTDNDNLPF